MKTLAVVCRWIARLSGAAFVALILTIAIGEGLPNPFAQPPTIQIGFLALALLLAGLLLGWWTELWGGLLSLGGWLLFVCVIQLNSRQATFVHLLCVPGVLFLVAAFARRRERRRAVLKPV